MTRWMAPSVLALAGLLLTAPVQAQMPAPAPAAQGNPAAAPAAPLSKREMRQQQRAAKKAERVAIRKRRADCYDQAQKQKLKGQPQVDFVRSCTAKPN